MKILRISGGVQVAKDVENIESKKVEELVEEACVWFSNRTILLVVDNIWLGKAEEDYANWIKLLRPLVRAGSYLLFSTRSRSLADGSGV